MSPEVSTYREAALSVFSNLLAFLLAATLSTAVLAGDLRAYFDRQSVYEGDTVTLVIETMSGTLGQPDLSGLEADFDRLGTSQSTNISIVNGKRTDTIRLLISLAPRHTGTIEVPSIAVGDERTGPLTLRVNEVPEAGTGSSGDDIFVEMEIDTDSGGLMVQQQAGLRVRLFAAVPLIDGNLEDPRADGALVTKLGEDRHYDTKRDGRDYRVIERHYSLSPERSGELRVAPIRFEGRMRAEGDRYSRSGRGLFNDPFFDRFFQGSPLSRDPFGMLEQGKRISARSRGITLEVKPRPGDYAGDHWLPAQELAIQDSWSENPPELRVGEPVTRTLTLQAKGLSGPQIPQIELPAMPGLRVYPEKGSSESRSDGETVYGISRQNLTLIPTRAGTVEIPEIRASWWDTVAQRERTTTVPGWTLKVAGGGQPGIEVEPMTQSRVEHEVHPSPSPLDQVPDEAGPGSKQPVPLADESTDAEHLYLIGGTILSVLLLAGSATWTLRRRNRIGPSAGLDQRTRTTDRDDPPIQGSKARKALRLACEANDASGAARALLDWAKATWPEDAPRNLGALSTRLDQGTAELDKLEQYLYAPASSNWDGATLWQVLQEGLSDTPATERQRAETLEPLYPRRI